MTRYTKAMEQRSRLPRLSVLPTWERLLSRFSAVGEASPTSLAAYLSLLGVLSDTRLTIERMLGRVCVALPKITQLDLAAILTLEENKLQVATASLSPRHLERLLQSKSLKREVQPRSSRSRISPPAALDNNRRIGFVVVEPLGEFEGKPALLLGASQTVIPTEEIKLVEMVSQLVKLRFTDQAAKRRAEHLNEQLSTLTQHLSDGMIILDATLKVTFWSRPLERLTGVPARLAESKSYDEVLQSETFELLSEPLQRAINDRRQSSFSADLEVITKRGQRRWFNFSGSVLRGRRESIEQIVIVVSDISHRKMLEQKKNEFISIATHEFRTPLTVIRGYLSLLNNHRKGLNERQRGYLDRATEASDRLVHLAEDLLQVVQIEQDRLQISQQRFELAKLLKKICRDFKVRAAQKGVSLTFSEPEFNTTVELDPMRTEQIFANLIDNALKYTLRGSVKVYFEQAFDRTFKADNLVVNIKDTGIGIPRENVAEIFEKFRRAHRLEQIREQGAGLGLFIVKSFTQKQGGRIEVRSRPGHGTLFSVTLPLAKMSVTARNKER